MRPTSLSFASCLLVFVAPGLSPGQEGYREYREASRDAVMVIARSAASAVRFTALALTEKISWLKTAGWNIPSEKRGNC